MLRRMAEQRSDGKTSVLDRVFQEEAAKRILMEVLDILT